MKTHVLARALKELSDWLMRAPNTELKNLKVPFGVTALAKSSEEIAMSLETLVALARVDKQRWYELIREYSFPIDVRPRDASRDILGKLLKYLESNPNALRRLRERTRNRAEPSDELLHAFEILLRDKN